MAAPGTWHYLRAFLPQGLALPPALWTTRHRFLLWVAATHAFALPFFAMSRGASPAVAVAQGAVVGLLALGGRVPSTQRVQSAFATVALLLSSTFVVHAAGGAFVAHAHYLLALALVALYQDWRTFTAAVAYVPVANVLLGLAAPGWAYPGDADVAKWALAEAVVVWAEAVVLLAFWSGAEHLRARSDLVLNSAGEGILGLDSNGTVTFANPAAHALFERAGDDLVGCGVRELMAGTRFSLAPTPGAPANGLLATRAGRQVPVEWTLTPTLRAGVGIGSVMVIRDVTARHDLERRLEARNRQQALVATLGHEALAGLGLEQVLTRVATVAAQGLDVDTCQVLEVQPGARSLRLRAAVGLGAGTVGTLLPPPPPGPVRSAFDQATPVVCDDLDPGAAAEALDGRRPASAIAMALGDRERPFGVLVAYALQRRRFTRDDAHFLQSLANLAAAAVVRQRDEAELRQHRTNLEALVERRTAQLTQANRELESFSYTVSHDLRSPLRAIGGFSRILRRRHDGDLPEDSKRLLQMIDDGAVRMGALIESVLLLTRIGRTRLAMEPIDVSALAHGILDELAAKAPQRAVTIDVQPGLRARGDPGLVRLALSNLLGNAWKFTSRKPQARIAVRAAEDGAFVIEDDGAGFDMALSADLFQPFHRLHEPTEFEGTGIGLATVDRIVQAHGGRIWAEAEPGKGARFTFTLRPARDEAGLREPQPPPPATVRLVARPRQPSSVLVPEPPLAPGP